MTNKLSLAEVSNARISFVKNDIIKFVIDGKCGTKKIDEAFLFALQHPQDVKKAMIHKIMLHSIQNSGERSLEDVLNDWEKAVFKSGTKNNPIDINEEFDTLNFQDKEGNTLLHHAVKCNNTKAITVLLSCDINPLIKDVNGKIPLDLAEKKQAGLKEKGTREVLIEEMEKQANSKKGRAIEIATMGGVFCTIVGLGIGSVICAGITSSPGIILGVIGASALVVDIAAGSTLYFLSQDYKQAKEIENTINLKPSSVNSEVSFMPVSSEEQTVN